MIPVIEITGSELEDLRRMLAHPGVGHVRVAIDGGFKVSVNHGMWTPPMGQARP